ncbi:hypothetical protein IWZ01DRAFT_188350 [Phyllosticta capitalensis]
MGLFWLTGRRGGWGLWLAWSCFLALLLDLFGGLITFSARLHCAVLRVGYESRVRERTWCPRLAQVGTGATTAPGWQIEERQGCGRGCVQTVAFEPCGSSAEVRWKRGGKA